MEGSTRTHASLFCALPSVPHTSAPRTPREAGPRQETHDPPSPHPVAGHRPRPPPFFVQCQTSYHFLTMPLDSLHLCAQKTQISLKNCLGGIIQVAITQEALAPRPDLHQEGRVRHQRPRSPLPGGLLGSNRPLQQLQSYARPWWRPRCVATSARMQLGAQTAPPASRPTCPTRATRTRWTPRRSKPLRETGSLNCVGSPEGLFDWDAILIRTALQYRLRIPSCTRTHRPREVTTAKSSIESPRVTRGSPRVKPFVCEIQHSRKLPHLLFSKSHQQVCESCTEIFVS